MPVDVDGVTYYSASDVAQEVGISRQSLWRQEGKVPSGRKYRDRQILFTAGELGQIKDYANRLEPAEPAASQQLRLFNNGHGDSK